MSDLVAQIQKRIATGLFPDLPHNTATLWKDGKNVLFQEKSIQPFPGQKVKFSRSETDEITGLFVGRASPDIDFIFFGTKSNLYTWDETNGIVEVTRAASDYTGTAENLWSFCQWNDKVLASNGKDAVQLFSGALFVDLPAATFTHAKKVLTRSPYCVAIGTDLMSNRGVHWCNDGDIATWAAAAGNSAGDIELPEMDSPITGAEFLGDSLLVYSQNTVYSIDYVGLPFVFSSRKLFDGIGVRGIGGVALIENYHYGIGVNGIWRTDGGRYEYFASEAVRDLLLQDLNFSALDKAWVHHLKDVNHVVFFYPSKDSEVNDKGLAYNYLNNTWTILGFGRNVASQGALFTNTLFGSSLGKVTELTPYEAGMAGNETDSGLVLSGEGVVNQAFGDCGFGQLGFGGGLECE